MPFRQRFDCLWCGRPHEARSSDDLEGWALLCPECVGRADENGFLRARVRSGLRERAAASSAAASGPSAGGTVRGAAAVVALPTLAAPPQAAPTPRSASTLPPATHDDWYLRRGRFSRGPLLDGAWHMELDQATSWLDARPLSGVIVELAGGTGWWSALLAGKGELWVFEPDEAALDQARRRLMAHGLMAHLHVRDPLAPPDRRVDAVFAAHLLSAAPDDGSLRARLAIVRDWLKPGGTFAFLEARPGERPDPPEAVVGPAGLLWPRHPDVLGEALHEARLVPVELTGTRSAFVMGQATSQAAAGPEP